MKKAALLTLIIFLISVSHLKAQQTKTYMNERFQYTVELPLEFVKVSEVASKYGENFSNKKGMVVSMDGVNNKSFEPAHLVIKAKESYYFDVIDKSEKGDNWGLIKGTRGNNIVYIKFFTGANINTLRIEFPKTQKQQYEKLAETIIKSFKPGNLKEFAK